MTEQYVLKTLSKLYPDVSLILNYNKVGVESNLDGETDGILAITSTESRELVSAEGESSNYRIVITITTKDDSCYVLYHEAMHAVLNIFTFLNATLEEIATDGRMPEAAPYLLNEIVELITNSSFYDYSEYV